MSYRIHSTPSLETLERRALLSAGQLDPTFGGGDGIVSVAAAGAFEDVAVLPGNKVLAVGTISTTAGARATYLARFNADGSYDTSFGSGDGVATGAFDAHRLALQSDGKILVFGSALARFKSDGTPDTSFGGGDGVVIPQAPGDGLGLQPDGKILTVEGDKVSRYKPDGSLDTNFGAGGRVALNFSLGRSPFREDGGPFDGFVPVDAAWQASSDKIVVGGHTFGSGPAVDFAAVRLNANGSLDTSFANGLSMASVGSPASDTGGRIDVAPDGTIAMAGNKIDNDEADLVLFDNDGTTARYGATPWIEASGRDVSFTPDGRIVVAGTGMHINPLPDTLQRDVEVMRFNRDLTINATFGGPQGVHTDVNNNSEDFGYGVAVQGDGAIVVAGKSDESPVLLRYDGGGLAAPQVVRAFVGGTGWSSSFLDFIDRNSAGDDRYGLAAGSGSTAAPAAPLPWTNLNQVAIQFNRPVSVEQGDLRVRGVNVADYRFRAFRYDPATRTAVWTLDRTVGADKLLLQLDGVELAGTGGTGGVAPYRSRIDVLPGDVNRDGAVLAQDYSEVKQRFFKSANDANPSLPGGYTIYHDVNGSGSILADDYSAVKKNFFARLPNGSPATATTAQSASASRPRPLTRTLFSSTPVLA